MFRDRNVLGTTAYMDFAAVCAKKPTTWLLLGDRLGDNAQVLALSARLGFPSEEKYLRHNKFYHLPNSLKGCSLISLQAEASSPLRAPWPDLVIMSGRKNVSAARWIKVQSGGHTKLVTIGRPRAPLNLFDLVLTTPQYRLPTPENVVELQVPLSSILPQRLVHARETWRHVLEELPAPHIALLVGGDTTTCVFDPVAADRLGRLASAYAKSVGGSLLLTTSPRTEHRSADALFAAISVPAKLHRWTRDKSAVNPYLGFLALADQVIVTCDSASMIADAVAAEKPVLLFDVPMQPRNAVLKLQHRMYLNAENRAARGKAPTRFHRFLTYLASNGFLAPPRDMPRLYRQVVSDEHAAWLVDVCVDPENAQDFNSDGMFAGVHEAQVRINRMFGL